MRRANTVITIALALAAVLAWVRVVFWSVLGLWSDPQIHLPCAVALSAAACLGWVLTWLDARRGDYETRCRRCGYILRGLTEPRCPECGERI